MKTEPNYTRARQIFLATGCILLIAFLVSTILYSADLIRDLSEAGVREVFRTRWMHLLSVFALELVLFWTGMIAVYLTSVQLGLKLRVIGLICGWIPVVHVVLLCIIISVTLREVIFEERKQRLDKKRAADRICQTKYPILLVHGVFFRDSKYLNYWGRIPAELEKNGATCFYGNHQSAASVEECAEELAPRIREIVKTTGCGKVNVIAHSKGGLDTRMAIATKGVAPYVASLTTINTPHRGCEFAEYLLGKAPEKLKDTVSHAYNSTLKKLGDPDPDFIEAVTDLTASACRGLWEKTEGFDYRASGIYTQSVGSMMKRAGSGAFPLNMSYHLVRYFDGPNDGLVGEPSFRWGENYTFLKNKGKRGISHGDMIDLNRANLPGFDVREFYVKLVEDLKARGC